MKIESLENLKSVISRSLAGETVMQSPSFWDESAIGVIAKQFDMTPLEAANLFAFKSATRNDVVANIDRMIAGQEPLPYADRY